MIGDAPTSAMTADFERLAGDARAELRKAGDADETDFAELPGDRRKRKRAEDRIAAQMGDFFNDFAGNAADAMVPLPPFRPQPGESDEDRNHRLAALAGAVLLSLPGSRWRVLSGPLADHLAQVFAAAAMAAGAGNAADVSTMARRWAQQRAAALVPELAGSTRDMASGAVAAGIAARDGASALAARLRRSPAFNADRARLVAENEVHGAANAGALHGYRSAGAVEKVWRTDPGACEICRGNALAGPIAINAAFPSGHLHPTAHPNCRCVIAPAASAMGSALAAIERMAAISRTVDRIAYLDSFCSPVASNGHFK